MTDEVAVLRAARERVAALKPGCARTIRLGSWDNGQLIRDAVAAVMRERQEAVEE